MPGHAREQLLGVADTILKVAEERQKPDAERKLGFQERDAKDLEQGFQAMQSAYDPDMDRAVFKLYLQRAAKLPEAERPEVLALVLGAGDTLAAATTCALAHGYSIPDAVAFANQLPGFGVDQAALDPGPPNIYSQHLHQNLPFIVPMFNGRQSMKKWLRSGKGQITYA